jgi:hypothetical protein
VHERDEHGDDGRGGQREKQHALADEHHQQQGGPDAGLPQSEDQVAEEQLDDDVAGGEDTAPARLLPVDPGVPEDGDDREQECDAGGRPGVGEAGTSMSTVSSPMPVSTARALVVTASLCGGPGARSTTAAERSQPSCSDSMTMISSGPRT